MEYRGLIRWWAGPDSNRRPLPCKGNITAGRTSSNQAELPAQVSDSLLRSLIYLVDRGVMVDFPGNELSFRRHRWSLGNGFIDYYPYTAWKGIWWSKNPL